MSFYAPNPDDTGYIRVATNSHAACALKEDGTVRCWGQNIWGELDPTPHP